VDGALREAKLIGQVDDPKLPRPPGQEPQDCGSSFDRLDSSRQRFSVSPATKVFGYRKITNRV
jgi:hypothetical protein